MSVTHNHLISEIDRELLENQRALEHFETFVGMRSTALSERRRALVEASQPTFPTQDQAHVLRDLADSFRDGEDYSRFDIDDDLAVWYRSSDDVIRMNTRNQSSDVQWEMSAEESARVAEVLLEVGIRVIASRVAAGYTEFSVRGAL